MPYAISAILTGMVAVLGLIAVAVVKVSAKVTPGASLFRALIGVVCGYIVGAGLGTLLLFAAPGVGGRVGATAVIATACVACAVIGLAVGASNRFAGRTTDV